MQTLKTDDVYGINRDLPLNYVARDKVDAELVDNLTRRKHIVIHGSSKQGKTSLRKHCLNEPDYILIQCQPNWALRDLHANILKRAGYVLTDSIKRTITGRAKVSAQFKAPIPGVEYEQTHSKETVESELELELEDVNDVIAALEKCGFNRYIVLEDFHYLPYPTQVEFAVALKAFHESSKYCFIIIGVWLEADRLSVYNGDLTGRIVSINADKWAPSELEDVIDSGARLLNIGFASDFKKRLISDSLGSVFIVQESCRAVCRDEMVFETQQAFRQIGVHTNVGDVVRTIVDQQSGRYRSFIEQFGDGFQTSQLEMYKWLLYPVLTGKIEDLERGIPQKVMRTLLQEKHPEGSSLNPGNLTQALRSVAALQVKKNIKPIILDYDDTNRRLRVVDSGFLIWLNNQDRPELLEHAGLDV